MATELTIGKLADAAGVNVETIRYYQRRGLLDEPAKPADSTPFGHSAHADPDTCSTIIRTGSRSAATQGLHC